MFEKKVLDAVTKLSGMTEEELLHPKKGYINNLSEVTKTLMLAVSKGERITIVGDYDVDGICATAILCTALQSRHADVKVILPRRFSDGYGLNINMIDRISSGLIITVDNGIAAAEAIKKAKDKGLAVIVTDHHLPPTNDDGENILPPADIIIDPHLPGTATFEDYSGAGVAMKIANLLDAKDASLFLALATVAVVADSVPLKGENRWIVQEGLKILNGGGKTTMGLMALCQWAGEVITEKVIGFKIAPAINAPGRIYDDGAMEAFELIMCNNKDAFSKVEHITMINTARKELKEKGIEEAKTLIPEDFKKPLVLYIPKMHEGIVGIIAGQIAEEYKTPCLVFTDTKTEGILKGSCRTYGGVHLKNLMDKERELFERYGGHAGAAGASIKLENLDKLRAALERDCPEVKDEEREFDLEVSESDCQAVYNEIVKYAPYGQCCPEPIVKVANFSPVFRGSEKYKVMNEKHTKFFGQYFDAVWFYHGNEEAEGIKLCSICGFLSENVFRGEATLQFEVEKLEPKTPKRRNGLHSFLGR